MYENLLFEIKDGICRITLNRPDRYNAFDEKLSAEFIDALKKTGRDSNIRCIVITGAGKAFCSGQDLKDVQGKNRSLGESVERRYNPMIRLVHETKKPFIAQLNGVAAGAGASLALACDYVVASKDASLLWAFANIGLVLDSGSSYFLPRLVGKQKAFELATLGNKISAEQAMNLGLVNQIVNAEDLEKSVDIVANHYAQAPTKAIGLIKRMLNRSFESNLNECLEMEKNGQEIAGRSSDYIEGTTAFIEKRKPVFSGK